MAKTTPHAVISEAIDIIRSTLNEQSHQMSLRQLSRTRSELTALVNELKQVTIEADEIEQYQQQARTETILDPLDQTIDAAMDLFQRFTGIGTSLTDWAQQRNERRQAGEVDEPPRLADHLPRIGIGERPRPEGRPARSSSGGSGGGSRKTNYAQTLDDLYQRLPSMSDKNIAVVRGQVEDVLHAIHTLQEARQSQREEHLLEQEQAGFDTETDVDAESEEVAAVDDHATHRPRPTPPPPPPQPPAASAAPARSLDELDEW